MVVDSGAQVHLVCPAHEHFMKKLSKLDVPFQLETAGGDLTLNTIGDLFCGGIVCHRCVFNPLLTVSLFSTSRGEKDGYFYERCPEGYRVLKGPAGITSSAARNDLLFPRCSRLARLMEVIVE